MHIYIYKYIHAYIHTYHKIILLKQITRPINKYFRLLVPHGRQVGLMTHDFKIIVTPFTVLGLKFVALFSRILLY